jgi:hypothetical protein
MVSYEGLYGSLQLEPLKTEGLRFAFLGISIIKFKEDEDCNLFRNVMWFRFPNSLTEV